MHPTTSLLQCQEEIFVLISSMYLQSWIDSGQSRRFVTLVLQQLHNWGHEIVTRTQRYGRLLLLTDYCESLKTKRNQTVSFRLVEPTKQLLQNLVNVNSYCLFILTNYGYLKITPWSFSSVNSPTVSTLVFLKSFKLLNPLQNNISVSDSFLSCVR